jgi:hypothetical protein
MVPPPFHPEGFILPNAVPAHFEQFYRATLRRVIGARARSSLVHDAYAEWAGRTGSPSISYRQLRGYMLALGHRHVKSNGIQYLDATFASEVPGTPDTFAVLTDDALSPVGIDATVSAIDGAVGALRKLRRALTGAS